MANQSTIKTITLNKRQGCSGRVRWKENVGEGPHNESLLEAR